MNINVEAEDPSLFYSPPGVKDDMGASKARQYFFGMNTNALDRNVLGFTGLNHPRVPLKTPSARVSEIYSLFPKSSAKVKVVSQYPAGRTATGEINPFRSPNHFFSPKFIQQTFPNYIERPPTALPTSHPSGMIIEQTQVKSGMMGSIFNLINAVLGAGILGFPYALSSTGLVSGVILVIVFMAVCLFTLYVVFRSWIVAKERYGTELMSYQEVTRFYVGSFAMYCHEIMTIIYAIGSCIAFMQVVKDSFHGLMVMIFPANTPVVTNPIVITLFFTCGFMYPLTSFRNMNALKYTSLVSLCAVCSLFVLVPVSFIVNWVSTGDMSSGIQDKGDILLNRELDGGFYPKFFLTLPLISYAFDCHIVAPILASELSQPKQWKMNVITVVSLTWVTIMYFVVGITGYLRFGDVIKPDILNSFNGGGSALDTVIAFIGKLSMGVVAMCSFPLFIFALRLSLISVFNNVKDVIAQAVHRKYLVMSSKMAKSKDGAKSCQEADHLLSPEIQVISPEGFLLATPDVGERDDGDFEPGCMYYFCKYLDQVLTPRDNKEKEGLQEEEERKGMSDAEKEEREKNRFELTTFPFVSVNIVIFVFCLLIVLVIPSLAVIMGIVGAVGATSQMFFFPALLMWNLEAKLPQSTEEDIKEFIVATALTTGLAGGSQEVNENIFPSLRGMGIREKLKAKQMIDRSIKKVLEDSKKKKKKRKKAKYTKREHWNLLFWRSCSVICVVFSVFLMLVGIVATLFQVIGGS